MWIRVDVATPDSRKAKRTARALEAAGAPPVPAHDPRVVLGTLVMLWVRARMQAPDGVLDRYTAADVAALVGCSDAEAEVLVEQGWLDEIPGGLEVHGWMEHNGDHLREAKRKASARAFRRGLSSSSAPEGAAVDFDSRPVPSRHVPSNGLPVDVRRTSGGHPPDTAPGAKPARLAARAQAPARAQDAAGPATARTAFPLGDVAEAVAGAPQGARTAALALAHWLFNRGVHHGGLLARFTRHYLEHAGEIAEPYAYYNPGREGFEVIYTRCAAEAATEEHEALKAAERRWVAGLGK